MEIQQIDINDIKPYPNNARKNDDTVSQIADSIKRYGWKQPIVIDKKNVIIVGHTRYKAAKQLLEKTVPVIIANMSTKEARAYRIMDNKSHDYTRWDIEALKYELDELDELDATNFSLKELDDILHPELGLIGGTKQGKIKGIHRVIVECNSKDHMEEIVKKVNEAGYWNTKINYY
tara:strand:+ start:172 stop:699 length:528 start_codon:yes stop_codon:yes gene_type:complete